MKAFVSIITPTFNHQDYISECIESVLNQTFVDWEMIIIDDGSSDDTAEIIQKYSHSNPKIRYFHQANKGLNKLHETYNFALSVSKGNFIAILEGDDYWLPTKLEKQIAAITEHNAVFCWGIAEARDNKKKYLEQYPINFDASKMPIYNNAQPALILNMMYEDFPVPLTWLIRKETILQIGGFVQSAFAPMLDRDTIFELSLHGKFIFIPETIGIYRRQIEQATGGRMLEISRACGEIFENFCKKLPKDIRNNVKFSEQEIQDLNNNNMLVAHSRFGRYQLRKRNFSEARKNYWISTLHKGTPSMTTWRIRSIVGLLFSLFRIDLEVFIKLLGKKNYK